MERRRPRVAATRRKRRLSTRRREKTDRRFPARCVNELIRFRVVIDRQYPQVAVGFRGSGREQDEATVRRPAGWKLIEAVRKQQRLVTERARVAPY